MASRSGRVVAFSLAFCVALLAAGCEDEPATKAELDAIAAMQQAHAHVTTDEKGHAVKIVLSTFSTRDSELAPLKELPELEELNLDGSPITDQGLVHLEGLKQLKRLSLRGTKVTDEGLSHLVKLPLEELDLERLAITDRGLQQLSSISSLRKVYVGPGGPTSAGKSALESANPRLHVMMK